MKLTCLVTPKQLDEWQDEEGNLHLDHAVFATPNGKTAAGQVYAPHSPHSAAVTRPSEIFAESEQSGRKDLNRNRKSRQKKSRKRQPDAGRPDDLEEISDSYSRTPKEVLEGTEKEIDRNLQPKYLRIEVEDAQEKVRELIDWQEQKGIRIPVLHGTLGKEYWKAVSPEERRIQILMNTSMIDESWCRQAIRPYLHPSDQVCVLAFSFFDDTKNLDDWNRQYQKGRGIWYRANTDVFAWFGIPEQNVHWVNYFTDTPEQMAAAIANSNVLLLTGGAPDLMMKRIREKKLMKYLRHYEGVVIGYSAGAMVQLGDYHIIPDADYPEFSWQKGLNHINDFDIEVHYAASPHQKRWLETVKSQNRRPVYCIYEKGGVIVDDKNEDPARRRICFGQVDILD